MKPTVNPVQVAFDELRGRVGQLEAENADLRWQLKEAVAACRSAEQAIRDAIRRPLGVAPDSAAGVMAKIAAVVAREQP